MIAGTDLSFSNTGVCRAMAHDCFSTQNAIIPIIISPWRGLLALKIGSSAMNFTSKRRLDRRDKGMGWGNDCTCTRIENK